MRQGAIGVLLPSALRGHPARTQFRYRIPTRARMAELVDALDLGSSAERRGGSSPPPRTIDRCGLHLVGIPAEAWGLAVA